MMYYVTAGTLGRAESFLSHTYCLVANMLHLNPQPPKGHFLELCERVLSESSCDAQTFFSLFDIIHAPF